MTTPHWFKVGARLLAGWRRGRGRVVEARRGRPARDPARHRARARAPGSRCRERRCRRPRTTSTTSSSSSGSRSSRRADGARSAASCASSPASANDALELGSGLLLPLVGACIRRRPRSGTYPCRARLLRSRLTPLRLDVFTLVPHAFAWLTEQRPVAAVLGGELDLRLLLLPRHDAARAAAGRRRALRRRRRNGAARRRRRGGNRRRLRRPAAQRVVGADAAGAPAHAGSGRGARRRAASTLLSARFEGFDERIVEHLAPTRSRSARTSSRTATCRRW